MKTDISSAQYGGLVCSIEVDTIPAHTQHCHIELNASEKRTLAGALEVVQVQSLIADIDLKYLGNGRVSAKGNLIANILQSCVVTLEPIECKIEETIDLQYWPEVSSDAKKNIDGDGESIIDPLGEDEPEYYTGSEINLARLVFESLSSAINPYPKKPGASLDWIENSPGEYAGDATADNPFAALNKLRTDNKE